MNQVKVFAYRDYRRFLKDYIEWRIAERNLSYRYFARKAGIASPNFLQQVVSGQRGLTAESALKVATGLQLKGIEKKFFVELVRLARVRDNREQGVVLDSLAKLAHTGQTQTMTSSGFHSSWLHGIVWELASIPNFELTDANLQLRLGHLAPLSELKRSREFLITAGFLTPTDRADVYNQASVRMESRNDFIDLDLRRKHQRYLEHAISSLEMEPGERENQGFTIAVSREKMALIKKRVRDFMGELVTELANDDQADTVLRVEVACSPLSRNQK